MNVHANVAYGALRYGAPHLNADITQNWGHSCTAQASLPPIKEGPKPIKWKSWWAPGPVWKLRGREKQLVPAEYRNTFPRSVTLCAVSHYTDRLSWLFFSSVRSKTV